MPVMRIRHLLLPLMLLLVLQTGCDVLDPAEEGIVTEHDQVFEFRTTSDALAGGATIPAESGLDVSSTVNNLGFGKGDIVSAEVISAELSRVTPLSLSLNDILSGATLRLSSGGSSTAAAQANSIGSGTTTEMGPAGGNIGTHARAASATVALQASPAGDLPSGNYVFRVRLRVRLTLEGV